MGMGQVLKKTVAKNANKLAENGNIRWRPQTKIDPACGFNPQVNQLIKNEGEMS
jgi:hypothetical protein